MKGHRIENADSRTPVAGDWSEFVTQMPLNREQAIELCRQLCGTPGAQPSWRVLDPEGRQILRLTAGVDE